MGDSRCSPESPCHYMEPGGSLTLVPLTVGGDPLTSLAEPYLGVHSGKPCYPL